MLRNVWLRSLRDQRNSLFWWAIGISSYVAFCFAFYPSMVASAEQMNAYLEAMPEAFVAVFMGEYTDMASPAGFMSTYISSLFVPMLFLFYAIGAGSDAIAGEEARGTLDLLLANPVSRRSVLVHKSIALIVAVAVLTVMLWLVLVASAYAVGMSVSYWGLLAVSLGNFLLVVCLGALALGVASATGSKGLGTGLATGVAAVSYLVNAFAPSLDWLRPYREVSLFYLYTGRDPLVNGLHPASVAVFLVLTVVFLAGGSYFFERRDLAV